MHARPLRLLTALGSTAALALALSACGSSSDGSSTSRPSAGDELTATPLAQATASPAADAKVIAITLEGETVTPSGTGVDVKLNQPVVLNIKADKAGELHVHSTPEKHIEFPAGDSTVTLTLDQPGVVDVEDHALDKLIVQLKVS